MVAASASSTHSRWLRWARNAAIELVGVIALYTLIGFLVVPPIARAQIEKLATQAFNRQATLARVDFNPLTLRATLHDFRIAAREAGHSLLALDALVVDISSASLWHRAPVLDALQLVHPRVDLVRTADGRYSMSDLLDRMTADDDGPTPL